MLKNDIKAEYRKQLHKGKYKTRYKTGRTVENVAVKDLSKKRYPLRKFELQFLDSGHNMIRGIEETNLQSNALEKRAESFLKEYQDKLLNNLWKAVKKSKKS